MSIFSSLPVSPYFECLDENFFAEDIQKHWMNKLKNEEGYNIPSLISEDLNQIENAILERNKEDECFISSCHKPYGQTGQIHAAKLIALLPEETLMKPIAEWKAWISIENFAKFKQAILNSKKDQEDFLIPMYFLSYAWDCVKDIADFNQKKQEFWIQKLEIKDGYSIPPLLTIDIDLLNSDI